MSNAELNSYRLDSMEEPSDEMLSAIMQEVAAEAAEKSAAAHKKFFDEIQNLCKEALTQV